MYSIQTPMSFTSSTLDTEDCLAHRRFQQNFIGGAIIRKSGQEPTWAVRIAPPPTQTIEALGQGSEGEEVEVFYILGYFLCIIFRFLHCIKIHVFQLDRRSAET